MQLPEHVTLCDQCGCAPAHDMTIPKWVFMQVGDCWCESTEDGCNRTDIDNVYTDINTRERGENL